MTFVVLEMCKSKGRIVRRLISIVLAMIALGPALAATATTPDYPTRTITMIVPYPAGGPSDVVARIIADGMSRRLGQTLVIENVGGAGGTIGTARVAAATPDGYTLLAASMGSQVAAPSLYPHLRYDSVKDFMAVGLTAHAPAAIVARKDFPAKNLREFIAYLKQHGDRVKQGHGGIGSSSHMACLLFTSQLGLKPQLIGYRGTGPALNDLIGGQIDFFCEQIVSVAPSVKGGTIKAYAISADRASPALPGVPPAKDAGAPHYQMSIWSAIFAPKGTPQPIVQRLSRALDDTLNDQDVRARIVTLGGRIPDHDERGPDKLETLLKAEIARWAPILKGAMAGN
ncbi:MAG TPA: tripartite tricarboxylate transporter substrate-binding protein [Xanthobacteraceae bacterium]|jgi:tripartite-type tricarboxylate transporter receptor subunit TctC